MEQPIIHIFKNGLIEYKDMFGEYEYFYKGNKVSKELFDIYSVLPESTGRNSGKCAISSSIERVIFNNPATIVYWNDKTKTIVKCQDGDEYNKEIGLAMCIIKKVCGNKGNYNDVFEKWCK